MRQRSIVSAAMMVAALSWAAPARAVDVEVAGTTAAQGYDVASPWSYSLERRRLLQTVGLSLYHLQGDYEPGKPDYNIRTMFRFDADFGIGNHLPSDFRGAEEDFSQLAGSRYVPGLNTARFDIMYAYVEGKNLADGWFGFRAGRQYVTDVLGWWSFDGGLARLTTPFFVDVEGYAGLEQRGGLPLSTSRFESQGVWRGSHRGFGEAGEPRSFDYPSYQFAEYAPAFGFALESNGPHWLHARLSYRRVYNTGEAFTQQFPDPGGGFPTADGTRISSDKLGFSGQANLSDLGGVKGGFAYDLYNQLASYAYGGIEGYIGSRVTAGLDFDYYEPTFDADSIWNWFTKSPVMTPTGRVAARFTDEIDMSAMGGARLWRTEGDPEELGDLECAAAGLGEGCYEQGDTVDSGRDAAVQAVARDDENRPDVYEVDGLGQLAARYTLTTFKAELRSMLQIGDRGRRVGGELAGEKTFDGGRYALGLRTSVYDFVDPLREDRDATSFSYVLGGGWRPLDVSRIGLEWEHSINDLVGQRFRVLARLDIAWVK